MWGQDFVEMLVVCADPQRFINMPCAPKLNSSEWPGTGGGYGGQQVKVLKECGQQREGSHFHVDGRGQAGGDRERGSEGRAAHY